MAELATAINEFFASVSENMTPLSVPPIHTEPLPACYTISVGEVERELMSVNIKKVRGPDNIPNWILRDLTPYLAGPTTAIFNTSLQMGHVPELWGECHNCPHPQEATPAGHHQRPETHLPHTCAQ